MFTNSQMLLLLLVLLTSFAESLYLPQNILGHGSMKAQIKLEAAFFPHAPTCYCPYETNSADQFITWGCNCQYTSGHGVTTILMQANLISKGSLDFYLPKCFGVYFQNSKNCKFPGIAFIDRLGKKEKISFIQHEHEKSPTRIDHCPFSPVVCLQKL